MLVVGAIIVQNAPTGNNRIEEPEEIHSREIEAFVGPEIIPEPTLSQPEMTENYNFDNLDEDYVVNVRLY